MCNILSVNGKTVIKLENIVVEGNPLPCFFDQIINEPLIKFATEWVIEEITKIIKNLDT